MNADRRERIIAQLYTGESGALDGSRLGRVCAEAAGVSGASIMLISGDAPRGSVAPSDAVAERLEDLQFDLGEGPCLDAYHADRPVLEPDLTNPSEPRWIAYTPRALAAGAAAVFAFPLRLGAAGLGSLSMYRATPGPLSDRQFADAQIAADVAAQAILILQADAPPGALANEIEASANFRHVVHQAAGMVAAQLDTNVAEALIRLRAHAFVKSRPLAEVAEQVVARRLRFNDGESAR